MNGSFSDVMAAGKVDGSGATFVIGDEWLQGRSVFGGLQGAIALRAMRPHVPEGMTLRTLQITFVGPIGGGEVRLASRVLRAGRNVMQVEARVGDDMIAVGVFGRARESVVAVRPLQPPVAPEHGEPRLLPYIAGVVPAFVQHFALRWLTGGFPFSGTPGNREVIEVDHLDGAEHATMEHIVALADVPPPVALSTLTTPTPASSITWTLDLLRDKVDDLPVSGYRLDVELVAANSGYLSQSIMIWGPRGEPVARGHQCMVVFG